MVQAMHNVRSARHVYIHIYFEYIIILIIITTFIRKDTYHERW